MKIVALISGGLDSTTLLYWLKARGHTVYALSICYGQRHERELEAARKICERANAQHLTIDMRCLQTVLHSALTGYCEVPRPTGETYEAYAESLQSTVVPNRNMILLSVAAGYAYSIDAHAVAYAAHASDFAVYPDCRPNFVQSLEETLRLSLDDYTFKVLAPFVHMNKSEIVKLGKSLGVPFELTWSCYKGQTLHCGECSSCKERHRAFVEANVNDPTRYQVTPVI